MIPNSGGSGSSGPGGKRGQGKGQRKSGQGKTTTKEGERATNAITISKSGKTNHSGKTSHTASGKTSHAPTGTTLSQAAHAAQEPPLPAQEFSQAHPSDAAHSVSDDSLFATPRSMGESIIDDTMNGSVPGCVEHVSNVKYKSVNTLDNLIGFLQSKDLGKQTWSIKKANLGTKKDHNRDPSKGTPQPNGIVVEKKAHGMVPAPYLQGR